MKSIDVIIVEDEVYIAELHAQFLRQMPKFNPVGIASNLNIARTMIKVHKPRLIILDNNLPDGLGIELLREIAANKSDDRPDVIFVTGSCHINTVKQAMQLGCFDYIIKPIAYERLKDTLNRYIKYCSTIDAYDNISQLHVDRLFNMQSRYKYYNVLPKGINEITLEKIKNAFHENQYEKYTAESLSRYIGISKTTARRYLEYCFENGFLQADNDHGRVGRPQCVYKKVN